MRGQVARTRERVRAALASRRLRAPSMMQFVRRRPNRAQTRGTAGPLPSGPARSLRGVPPIRPACRSPRATSPPCSPSSASSASATRSRRCSCAAAWPTPAAARAWLAAAERHEPSQFAGIDDVCERILGHVRAGRRITIHGDYDVDGVCSTAILVGVLRALGADVDWFLPSRAEDGYGLSIATVQRLAARGTKLLITADCAITAVDEVAAARAAGIDVVVTDHHSPRADGVLPDAPIVHPAVCGYPCVDLCAAGVAYKLAARAAGRRRRGPRATPTATSTSSRSRRSPTACRCAARTAASCAPACARWPRRSGPACARSCASRAPTRRGSTRPPSAFASRRGSTPPAGWSAPTPASSCCSRPTRSAPRRSPTSSTA